MKFYEVGGAVRDSLLGIESKDVDFAVEAESFSAMEQGLIDRGFKIFLSTPEFLTVRAAVPSSESALYRRTKVADFVMCRKDSATGDGRRPDSVEPGDIYDDLARRDFTVNAIARDPDSGKLIDPHGGEKDLQLMKLQFVGEPNRRIEEDGLRVLRGYRFMITKNLSPTAETWESLDSPLASAMLHKVSAERIREELEKMFAHDNLGTMMLLAGFATRHHNAIWRDGLRLMPTMKK